ncbi:hypothetical protein [Streptomyces cavernicola]|uniref:Uncharacterized protein n=1 Tax=Streptomyces cavernicola TaxID=3043613 RepID=A0ABT6SIR1_9ACTN|nr:hypothetical protein [Streptomyces sp. B-S-A6]MDI3407909.1 hypothetical protein [Streptomyces sp. B-S-A6]
MPDMVTDRLRRAAAVGRMRQMVTEGEIDLSRIDNDRQTAAATESTDEGAQRTGRSAAEPHLTDSSA